MYGSEHARDRALPLVKNCLREIDSNARAQAYLTKYELEHKSAIYGNLKKLEGVKLMDWGNKVMVVVENDEHPDETYKRVIHLSHSDENINGIINDIKTVVEGDWEPVTSAKSKGKTPYRSNGPKQSSGKQTSFKTPAKGNRKYAKPGKRLNFDKASNSSGGDDIYIDSDSTNNNKSNDKHGNKSYA